LRANQAWASGERRFCPLFRGKRGRRLPGGIPIMPDDAFTQRGMSSSRCNILNHLSQQIAEIIAMLAEACRQCPRETACKCSFCRGEWDTNTQRGRPIVSDILAA
jgi:hypothetical protein